MFLALRDRVFSLLIRLGNERECNLCGWRGMQFLPYGNPRKRRWDARCPRCGSLERHRLAHYLLRDELAALRPRTLHVAPERAVEGWLRSISSDYLSIDLTNAAMRREDLTALTLNDGQYDLVWCSHVLEHIPQDRQAMREMFRVLAPGGLAVVQVPMWRQVTEEDLASDLSPEERLARYYQADHVRLYGMDIVDRLREAGFDVEIRRASDCDPAAIVRHGLSFVSTLEGFVCRKPDVRSFS